MYSFKFFRLLVPVLFLFFTTVSCSDDSGCNQKPNTAVNQAQLQLDIDEIDAYLSENNIGAEVHDSGLRYVINEPGDGKTATLCDRITVRYEGRLMSDGSGFDDSDGKNIAFPYPLSRLIIGWQVGIPLIEEGGSITLYVPSSYGYGSRGAGDDIPPNANLIFEISLAKVF
ncbi:FKBP-type peptidyl-prolyl cis-trans isomerase [Gracilimonas sp. BCB1]|uniref:FKBP-type peptidyl-prolyl cis-trans isomerase n=1 Tax=Gracilimonas sp. BCB1 TaxID=3152362 RepID=UPI003F86B695